MTMDRRELLAGLLTAPAAMALELDASGQEAGAPDPSLYIPKAHLVEDRTFLHDFMDEFAFVDLVTATPTLRITHIPTFIDRGTGRYGTIFGHISAQNPQRQTFDGGHTAIVVFRGPQAYISPAWYAKRDVVPTWNFGVVHASGRPKAIEGPEAARTLLARLIRKFEQKSGTNYDFDSLPADYVAGMMKGIAPFSMEVEALEGKFKLGQERSEGDRQGVLEHLATARPHERTLRELTAAFYARQGK
ncbi:MAG: FMN-binding negative transcriptional regulator [Acidobacteriota bacterium]|nr:FMN-binding negative transcriptional regulator [Acidobacteriota bacterium]